MLDRQGQRTILVDTYHLGLRTFVPSRQLAGQLWPVTLAKAVGCIGACIKEDRWGESATVVWPASSAVICSMAIQPDQSTCCCWQTIKPDAGGIDLSCLTTTNLCCLARYHTGIIPAPASVIASSAHPVLTMFRGRSYGRGRGRGAFSGHRFGTGCQDTALPAPSVSQRKIKDISMQEIQAPEEIEVSPKIRNVKLVASFNWKEALDDATILVPGEFR